MESIKIFQIADKLNNREKFGLFEEGNKCYFEDGTRVRYDELWGAIKIIHPTKDQSASLKKLFPDTFIGVFDYKFSRHLWARKSILNKIILFVKGSTVRN